MKDLQKHPMNNRRHHLWIAVLLLSTLSGRLHGAEGESVQIGGERLIPSTLERRRIWPPTKDLVNLPLDKYISRNPTQWAGYSLNEYFALCKEVLNRPCSFEATDAENVWDSTSTRQIHLTNTTPAKVLDAILEPYPDYHWVIRDDVVNVEPIRPLKKDVLSRKIDHLLVDHGSSFKAAFDALEQAKIRWASQSVNGIAHGTFARVTLELRNVTAREALNAIAREDGQIMWEFFPTKRTWKIERDGTLFMPSYRKNGVDEHFKE